MMATTTPHRLLDRTPGLRSTNINTTSNPSLGLAASTAIARKVSLVALTATQPNLSPTTAGNKMLNGSQRDIEVGAMVDVPGNMHGVVRFVGTVNGKKGVFAGVELSREYAQRGKNDGDVDGVRYFKTSIPGSGIFLPLNRASRRPSRHSTDAPLTPSAPQPTDEANTPQPKSIPMFTQSVGPGARPPSPNFKPKSRQSLPRPGSPLRKGPIPPLPPPTTRALPNGSAALSKSQIGAPRSTNSPAPRQAVAAKTPQRPYSRISSQFNSRNASNNDDSTPTGPQRSSDGSVAGSTSSGSGFTPAALRTKDESLGEIGRLKIQLEERDRQLKEQAVSLAEMESSFVELQALIPENGNSRARNGGPHEDADSAQLRAIIREKNDKISMLVAEFDNHRADFRSTIDTLEMASTETERVYEKRVEELLTELRDLHDRTEDVDTVAQQLKQLEELVQELEEGLEDARRGEAEARGEVEFLRGEVERTRAELRREREKPAAVYKAVEDPVKNDSDSRDVEQRDDEIRGLKAIIHSLSSGPDLTAHPRMSLQRSITAPVIDHDDIGRLHASLERLEREKKELQGLVERKVSREEELERELGKFQRASVISNPFSDRTAKPNRNSGRDSKGTVMDWRGSRGEPQPLAPMAEADSVCESSTTGSAILSCEICDGNGHDILTCPNMNKIDTMNSTLNVTIPRSPAQSPSKLRAHYNHSSISSQDPDKPKPLLTNVRARTSLPPPPGAAPTGPLPHPMGMMTRSSPPRANFSPDATTPKVPLPQALKISTPSPALSSLVAGKDGTKNANKWCAMCEYDGHDSINCSLDDQF